MSLRSTFFALMIGTTILAGAAQAGTVYVSGQDSDDSGHVSLSYGAQLLGHVGDGATNGGSGILILGGYAGQSATTINNWNTVAGKTLVSAQGATNIGSVSFSGFAGILLPSANSQVNGGISQAELDAINLRAADIASFVNGGGNLMAFTEQGLTNAFGWFPLGALTTSGISTANVGQTANLALSGLTATDAEISGDLYHNDFIGPAGFYGLQVLATDLDTGNAVILGGGVETQIEVPEPASMALLGAGLFTIGAIRRRRASR